MRRFWKIFSICFLSIGVTFSFSFFIYPLVYNDVHIPKKTNEELFYEELITPDTYAIKNAKITYYTTNNNNSNSITIDNAYDISFNCNLDLKKSDNIKCYGNVHITYKNATGASDLPLLNSKFTYINNIIYLENSGVMLGNNNFSFELDGFTNFINLISDYVLNSSFNLGDIFSFSNNFKELKKSDDDITIYKYKTFYTYFNNNRLLFDTDENFKISSIYTLKNEDLKISSNEFLRINILNMTKGAYVSIQSPFNFFNKFDNLLTSMNKLLTKYKEDRGISLFGNFKFLYKDLISIEGNNLNIDIDKNKNIFITNNNNLRIKAGLFDLIINGNIRIYDSIAYFDNFLNNEKAKLDLKKINENAFSLNYKNLLSNLNNNYLSNKEFSFIKNINTSNTNTKFIFNEKYGDNVNSVLTINYNSYNLSSITLNKFNFNQYSLNFDLNYKNSFNDFSADYNSLDTSAYIDRTDYIIILLLSLIS